MGFWIRYIVFGVVLAIAAYFLLINQGLISSIAETFLGEDEVVEVVDTEDGTTSTSEDSAQPAEEKIEVPVKKVKKKSSNAAAEGLSRFYASINPSPDGKGPRIRDNIVYLPEPKGNLKNLLEARKKTTTPLRKNWRGDKDARPFRTGETLYQKLSEYATEQGVEVMWRLDRDFLIKDPFRIDKDVLKTAFQIGKAVEGHFQDGISIFFCYNQRALVLISGENGYLEAECSRLSNKQTAW